MRRVFLVVCLLALFVSGFGFEEEKSELARSWSLSDPLAALLVIAAVFQVCSRRWKLDRTAVCHIAGVFILGVSAALNGAMGNGTLLNFGRTALVAATFYVVGLNAVKRTGDVKFYGWLCLALTACVYAFSLPNMREAWSADFTNLFFVFGVVDLNTFGFIFVLLFCATAPLWAGKALSLRHIFIPGVMAIGAMLSLSRSAWMNFAIAVAIIMAAIARTRAKAIQAFALGASLIVAVYAIQHTIGVLPEAQRFAQKKIDEFGDDAVQLRIMDLTVEPIKEWASGPFSGVVFGDAVSQQHTFIANALCMGGVFLLACGIGMFWTMIGTAVHALRRDDTKIAGCCLLALTVTMFMDDSATNHRYHSQLISYLFCLTGGSLSGFIRYQKTAKRWIMVREFVAAPQAESSIGIE